VLTRSDASGREGVWLTPVANCSAELAMVDPATGPVRRTRRSHDEPHRQQAASAGVGRPRAGRARPHQVLLGQAWPRHLPRHGAALRGGRCHDRSRTRNGDRAGRGERSGKTTVARMLAKIINRRRRGVARREAGAARAARSYARQVQMVFQDPSPRSTRSTASATTWSGLSPSTIWAVTTERGGRGAASPVASSAPAIHPEVPPRLSAASVSAWPSPVGFGPAPGAARDEPVRCVRLDPPRHPQPARDCAIREPPGDSYVSRHAPPLLADTIGRMYAGRW